MAIQIKYPFINAVSVALSASRGSPAKLFATGGSANGIPFAGELFGTGSEVGIGRNFTINEYVDGSVSLDRNNIILFRRGMPFRYIRKTNEIIVPTVRIRADVRRASVSFSDTALTVGVDRMQGTDTLGSEDWAENPCASSAVRYRASEALAKIGAPGAGDFLCSYEGQHRSVLASIYADAGCTYWWNFAGGGIGKICRAGGGNFGNRTGCNIVSSVSGDTKDGTRSHGSFTYQRSPTEEIRSVNFTRSDISSFSVPSYKGIIYPSFQEILRSIWGGIDSYQDLVAGRPPNQEYINFGIMDLPSISDEEKVYKFNQKFSWDPEKSDELNWSKILGIPDVRTNAWGGVEAGDEYTAGTFFLVRKAPPKFYRATTMEFFYPYNEVDIQYPISNNTSPFGSQVKTTSVSVKPPATARGRNSSCPGSADDLLGVSNTGLWRSVQLYSPDDLEEGILDFSVSNLSIFLQESISDCVIAVNAEPFMFAESLSYEGTNRWVEYIEGNISGTLRNLIKRGYSIVWVRPPRLNVNISGSAGGINCNDLGSVSGYVDPNDLVSADGPRENSKPNKIKSVCSSPIQAWLDKYGVVGADQPSGENLQPGLTHANGEGISISCGNGSKSFVLPSTADYIVVRNIVTEFDVSAKLAFGSTGGGSWASKGSSSGSAASHTVSVTDITPDNGGGVINVPNNAGGGQIGYSKYTATDFCCPINGLLESLNVNIGPDGVSVSYSYRGISPAPGITQVRVSNKGLSRGSVTV